jgi:hypothetical protein
MMIYVSQTNPTNTREHRTGWALQQHLGHDQCLLSHHQNQVNSQPHPEDSPVWGKGSCRAWGETLLDIKQENTGVSGDRDSTGKGGGLPIFWTPMHCATKKLSGPEALITSAGSQAMDPRREVKQPLL